MVSAFGMCCGYYEKFKAGTINIEAFYKRRYEKLWPFFALLCILDVVISPSADSVYEIFANLTMLQGLLPNPQISVVGVSWTLAVIFVFYLLFPFFWKQTMDGGAISSCWSCTICETINQARQSSGAAGFTMNGGPLLPFCPLTCTMEKEASSAENQQNISFTGFTQSIL